MKEYCFTIKNVQYSVFVPYYTLYHLTRVVRNETLQGAVRLVMLWSIGREAMTEKRLGMDSEKASKAAQFTRMPLSVLERHFILGNKSLMHASNKSDY